MNKKNLITTSAPKAIGAYSQGIKINDFIFTSGQIPLEPKSGKLVNGDIKLESKQVLKNLDAVLKAGGSSLNQIIKLTVFLIDLRHIKDIDELFKESFKNEPARTTVQVSALPMNARLEIEAIGFVK